MKNRVKHFYSHLISIDDLEGELSVLEVSEKEKEELMDIAHINLHQAIIDVVLSHLSEADKKKFLELMAFGEDEKIWRHLNSKVEKIEEKIASAAAQIKEELTSDIKAVKTPA